MDFNITEDDLFGLESMDRNMKLNKQKVIQKIYNGKGRSYRVKTIGQND